MPVVDFKLAREWGVGPLRQTLCGVTLLCGARRIPYSSPTLLLVRFQEGRLDVLHLKLCMDAFL